jgi:nucleoside-diphosphate-sugar epimerase
MKVAITGGTGFVGRTLARDLVASGHEVVLIARGVDRTDPTIHELTGARFVAAPLDDVTRLSEAFQGCAAVVHCAGINRESGRNTFQRIHVAGTRHVVDAARRAGVRKLILTSFLRARPDCGSGYHESKWAAEEIVRHCGLDYTVFKAGVIYGHGDHMLDHLSHAFHTFPVFGFVGFADKWIRPVAVEDMVRLLRLAIETPELSRRTVAVLGPEALTLREAVRRVARVMGRRPWFVRLPVWLHYLLAAVLERIMVVPMVSVAQVRMLSEGIADPHPSGEALPQSISPRLAFSEAQIRKGLPQPKPFALSDFNCCARVATGGGR